MASPSNPTLPPHYILVSQSQLPSTSHDTSGPSSLCASTLVHPIIHYHYADDPPLSLLPSAEQTYLIMDWDPSLPDNGMAPAVRSISEDTAVVGLKVSESAGEDDGRLNSSMYVLETISNVPSFAPSSSFTTGTGTGTAGGAKPGSRSQEWSADPVGAVLRFKQRNATLREVLDYGALSKADVEENEGIQPVGEGAVGSLGVGRTSLSPTSSPSTMKNVPLAPL